MEIKAQCTDLLLSKCLEDCTSVKYFIFSICEWIKPKTPIRDGQTAKFSSFWETRPTGTSRYE